MQAPQPASRCTFSLTFDRRRPANGQYRIELPLDFSTSRGNGVPGAIDALAVRVARVVVTAVVVHRPAAQGDLASAIVSIEDADPGGGHAVDEDPAALLNQYRLPRLHAGSRAVRLRRLG